MGHVTLERKSERRELLAERIVQVAGNPPRSSSCTDDAMEQFGDGALFPFEIARPLFDARLQVVCRLKRLCGIALRRHVAGDLREADAAVAQPARPPLAKDGCRSCGGSAVRRAAKPARFGRLARRHRRAVVLRNSTSTGWPMISSAL
jgi:hypothetical protein